MHGHVNVKYQIDFSLNSIPMFFIAEFVTVCPSVLPINHKIQAVL